MTKSGNVKIFAWDGSRFREIIVDTAGRLQVDGNIIQVGGTAQTGRDWSGDFSNLPYIGTERQTHYGVDAGNITIGAGSVVNWLSVSGLGLVLSMVRHYSSGIPPANARCYPIADGDSVHVLHNLDIDHMNRWGYTTVNGFYVNAVVIVTWDTANNIYEVRPIRAVIRHPFRSTLVGRLENLNTYLSSTQSAAMEYTVFTASSRALVKLPRWLESTELREILGLPITYPITVRRLGYFSEDPPFPFPDLERELPNRYDEELRLPGGAIAPSASERVQNFIAEIYYPKEVSPRELVDKIPGGKILIEEKG